MPNVSVIFDGQGGLTSTVRCFYSNVASQPYSTILGGQGNTASGCFSVVTGGRTNTASSCFTSIFAGRSNTSDSQYGFIGGGQSNKVLSSTYSVLVGGCINSIRQSPNVCTSFNYLGGGYANTICDSSVSVLGGGALNLIKTDGDFNTISGGRQNSILDSIPGVSVFYSVIGGGYNIGIGGSYSRATSIGNATIPTTLNDQVLLNDAI